MNKNILLLAAIALIAGAIWHIESSKPSAPAGSAVSIAAAPQQEVASTTAPAGAEASADRTKILKQKSLRYPPAVEIIPGGQFINSEPFKLKDIVGKQVILIDFWTYTCINCLRTLPYLKAWDAKYKDRGLVVVGVHSPEFDFEKDYNNVLGAVKKLGVKYPVVQDNGHATWNAYQNQYWPHKYLIDIDGYIVYDHIGEGGYADTERAIQSALQERAQALGLSSNIPTSTADPLGVTTVSSAGVQSPEVYFGADRNEYLGTGTQGIVGAQQLLIHSTIKNNTLYLGGAWNIQREFSENQSAGAQIKFKYGAKNVYLVARADKPVTVTVFRDGVPLTEERGADVDLGGRATIHENRLYHLIGGKDYGEHTLEIQIEGAGLQAYTFTFG